MYKITTFTTTSKAVGQKSKNFGQKKRKVQIQSLYFVFLATLICFKINLKSTNAIN